MDSTRRSMSRDYTRGLAWPVMWGHWVGGWVWDRFSPLTSWATAERRRVWAVPLVVAVIGTLVLIPIDGWVQSQIRTIHLGGDVRRELEALQQYGQLSVSVIIAVVIVLLDPRRARRLLDWGLALGITAGLGLILKMTLGRPRPVHGESMTFLGPIGARPLPNGEGGEAVVRPIEFWADGVSTLWSMPSSHTAAAAVMSVFLGMMYPKLRALVAVLVGVVALGRIMTGAHYPSDVLAGACLGAAVTGLVVGGGWGVRLVDRVWVRWVDRDAVAAWPEVAQKRE